MPSGYGLRLAPRSGGSVRPAVRVPTSDNVELVRQGYQAFARRDLTAVLSLLAPDFEWHGSNPDLPAGGVYRGTEAVAEGAFAAVAAHWQRFDSVPDRYLDAGDQVVVTGRIHARPRGGGDEVDVPFAHVWELLDGNAVRMQAFTDTAALKAALER